MRHVFLVLLAMALTTLHGLGVCGRRHRRREWARGERGYELQGTWTNNTRVIAQVGGSTTIQCHTHILGPHLVSWLKQGSENYLLTAGLQIYTSDSRFSLAHNDTYHLWSLSIKNVKFSDAGRYECQLATHPPTSIFFTLQVLEPRAMIQGQPAIEAIMNQPLRLHCTVQQALDPPLYIFWYHNNTLLSHGREHSIVRIHRFSSTLKVTQVDWSDAGAYRCDPHMIRPAWLTVKVLGRAKTTPIDENSILRREGVVFSSAPPCTCHSSLLLTLLLLLLQASPMLVVGRWCPGE